MNEHRDNTLAAVELSDDQLATVHGGEVGAVSQAYQYSNGGSTGYISENIRNLFTMSLETQEEWAQMGSNFANGAY